MAFIIGSIIIGIILFLSRNGERAFYFKNSLYYKVYKIKLLLFIPYYHRKIIDDYRGKIQPLLQEASMFNTAYISNPVFYNFDMDLFTYVTTCNYRIDGILKIYQELLPYRTGKDKIQSYISLYLKLNSKRALWGKNSHKNERILNDLKMLIINDSTINKDDFFSALLYHVRLKDKRASVESIMNEFYRGMNPEYQLGVII